MAWCLNCLATNGKFLKHLFAFPDYSLNVAIYGNIMPCCLMTQPHQTTHPYTVKMGIMCFKTYNTTYLE